jgi:hypothetical protein
LAAREDTLELLRAYIHQDFFLRSLLPPLFLFLPALFSSLSPVFLLLVRPNLSPLFLSSSSPLFLRLILPTLSTLFTPLSSPSFSHIFLFIYSCFTISIFPLFISFSPLIPNFSTLVMPTVRKVPIFPPSWLCSKFRYLPIFSSYQLLIFCIHFPLFSFSFLCSTITHIFPRGTGSLVPQCLTYKPPLI